MFRSGHAAPPSGPSREEGYALAGTIFILIVTIAWWALALWPVDAAAPAWLTRTRFVCFGASDNGLPNASGWIGLVGEPLGMLAALYVGWGRGVRGLARRVRDSRSFRGAAAGLALVVLLAGGAAGWRVASALGVNEAEAAVTGALPSTYPRLDRQAPPLALMDQEGSVLTLDRFRGRPALLTFGYAHCETVCPLLVRDVLAAQARLRQEDAARAPVVLVVTLDPWRDTPNRLPAIARAWGMGEGAYLLGGPVPEVEAALDAWGVARHRDTRTGEVTHPSLVYVLDGEGRIAFAATGGVGSLVELVKRL